MEQKLTGRVRSYLHAYNLFLMNQKLPISVHVLTFNSQDTLRRALGSVSFCKEIIVIDGGSTDETLQIGEEFGATVIPQRTDGSHGPITHFGSVRNRGLEAATQPWILVLDSDEYLSVGLQSEIKELVESNANPAAFLVPRRYVLPDGTIIMHATTYPNERFYFFHRDVVEKWIKPVHERPQLKEDAVVKHLTNASLAPIGTVDEFMAKNRKYIAIEAESSRGKGWMHWLQHRLYHTLRSRVIGFVRLLMIWLTPKDGPRLPLKHELLRFWYGWQLIIETCPLKNGRAYYQVLPRAQKLFSVASTLRTGIPTVGYYLNRKPIPNQGKPLIFTSTIFPPNAIVWHHFVQKHLGDRVNTVIFDCSGFLDPARVPGAYTQKMMNFMHPTKVNEVLYHTAENHKICWICDDDMYPISPLALDYISAALADPKTASLSFRPRHWWHFEIEGKQYEPSGSYCVALNRETFIKENLTMQSSDGNTHPTIFGDKPRRYDTGDKANEILLQKEYNCSILPEEERNLCVRGFTGVSGAALLLWYFNTPEEMLNFYLRPPKEKRSSNVLYGTLQSLLSLAAVLDLYEKITGETYAMNSLPDRNQLKMLRKEYEPFLKGNQSFASIDETQDVLKKYI